VLPAVPLGSPVPVGSQGCVAYAPLLEHVGDGVVVQGAAVEFAGHGPHVPFMQI
jgi:hypothetical protein